MITKRFREISSNILPAEKINQSARWSCKGIIYQIKNFNKKMVKEQCLSILSFTYVANTLQELGFVLYY